MVTRSRVESVEGRYVAPPWHSVFEQLGVAPQWGLLHFVRVWPHARRSLQRGGTPFVGTYTMRQARHPFWERTVIFGGAKGEVVELPIGRVRLTNATLLWQLRIEVFLVREEIVCRYD